MASEWIPKRALKDQLAAATARADALDAELLRVRTTGHGAAHELDNIAIECGLGHSPKPGVVAAHVRAMKDRAEKAEALYAKAWAECRRWRNYYGSFHAAVLPTYGWWTKDGQYDMPTADAHDAARKEAGLC